MGGVSREQVFLTLNLDQRLTPTPVLKQALLSGEVSINKLTRIVSIATPETQDFWINQSKLLSNRALETLIKDTKGLHVQTSNHNKTKEIQKVEQSDELQLSSKVKERLLALQNRGLDLSQMLEELLDKREQKIQEQKRSIARQLQEKKPSHSRYIPKKVINILQKEFGSKCAHSNCTNVSVNTHHQRRFTLDASHDPAYLVPFCKFHHEIAHAIDVRVTENRRIKISG